MAPSSIIHAAGPVAAYRFLRDPVAWYEKYSLNGARDPFVTTMGGRRMVVTGSYETYVDIQHHTTLDVFEPGVPRGVFGEHSILWSEGAQHTADRKLLGEVIHVAAKGMRAQVAAFIAHLEESPETLTPSYAGAPRTVDLVKLCQDMLASAVANALSADDLGFSAPEIRVLARRVVEYINALRPMYAFVPATRRAVFGYERFRKAHEALRETLRLALPECVLVKDGAEYWIDNLVALFFAAVDATSVALAGALGYAMENDLEPSEAVWRSYVRQYPPVPFVPRLVLTTAGPDADGLYRFKNAPSIALGPGDGLGLMVSTMLQDPHVPIGAAFGFSGRRCLGSALATDILDYAVPALGTLLYSRGFTTAKPLRYGRRGFNYGPQAVTLRTR